MPIDREAERVAIKSFNRGILNREETLARLIEAGMTIEEAEAVVPLPHTRPLSGYTFVVDFGDEREAVVFDGFAAYTGKAPFAAIAKFNGECELYDCIGPNADDELRRYYQLSYGCGPDGIAYFKQVYVS